MHDVIGVEWGGGRVFCLFPPSYCPERCPEHGQLPMHETVLMACCLLPLCLIVLVDVLHEHGQGL